MKYRPLLLGSPGRWIDLVRPGSTRRVAGTEWLVSTVLARLTAVPRREALRRERPGAAREGGGLSEDGRTPCSASAPVWLRPAGAVGRRDLASARTLLVPAAGAVCMRKASSATEAQSTPAPEPEMRNAKLVTFI